eukprot:CAMPEP_0184324028 /NCGR_PEP_ID=MMETSP1049-20130417/133262_1 /TAXON_ID=77928 /ORGANISM="Proteomonas sulcata, Strain CCMP704" /LENGTH=404 /DNA_ID=CAMNT_0026645681 /DNA_START=122 /DNA_END=1336 /DNA_ORIENTATION=-
MAAEDLKVRVKFTYEQCLSFLPFYPEIWFEGSIWYGELGDKQQEGKMLKRGIAMNPQNIMLTFALAEKHESDGKIQDAKQIYEDMCENQPSPLAFIHYMRFARRSESVAAARAVFKQARKSTEGCSWHVFCDAALREYRINKDAGVARNVFEKGLEHYGTEVSYILNYLDFLIALNDDNNTRVVFEKVLAEDNGLDSSQALQIWNRFVDFEYSRGNLSSISKVEKRRAALYPELKSNDGLAQLACRYRCWDMWPCDDKMLQLWELPDEGVEGVAKSRSSGGGPKDIEREPEGKKLVEPAIEPKRVVPLPPIPHVIQDLLHQLPSGPIPNAPNADEVLNMIHAMIIPPRFYKPPSTMAIGRSGFIPGTSMGGPGKRGREDEDMKTNPGGDVFRQRQKQRYANITD